MVAMGKMLALLLVACLALQSIWDAEAAVKRRVRKEIRKLSSKELQMYKTALRVMYHVSTADGQKIYGSAYKDMEYYMLKHAAAAYDPRGDQAHFSPTLVTFHRAFLLEMEETILSIVPGLKAAPYWDVSLDGPTGPYWGKGKVITDEQYLGPINGDEKYNFAVTKGFSAWQPIKTWVSSIVQPGIPDVNFTYNYILRTASGGPRIRAPRNYFRGTTTNNNSNQVLTRFPAYELRPNGKAYPYFRRTRLPGSNIADIFQEVMVGSAEEKQTIGFNFSTKEYAECLDPNTVTSWSDHALCVDFSTIVGFWPNPGRNFNGTVFKKRQILHTIWHTIIGSFSPDVQSSCNDTCLQGDAGDSGFAPMEIFSFFLHHANVDRSAMHWQVKAAEADPSMATNATLWKYPVTSAEWPGEAGRAINVTAWGGILRDDVISSNFPFTQFGKGSPVIPGGWTHKDILAWTNPLGNTLPYTYDTLR